VTRFIKDKDIEIIWKQYYEDAVNKGVSVAQFFESNGVPYHTFEKWYRKKFSKAGIVDCVGKRPNLGCLHLN